MKNRAVLILDLAGAAALPPKLYADDKDKPMNNPAPKGESLRQPGFLFVELDCEDLDTHIDFFKAVAGFELKRKDGNFVVLHSERGEILLNGFGGKSPEKPPRYQGPRVEIGIVVADLDKVFAEAKRHEAWKIAAGIQRQSWGGAIFESIRPMVTTSGLPKGRESTTTHTIPLFPKFARSPGEHPCNEWHWQLYWLSQREDSPWPK